MRATLSCLAQSVVARLADVPGVVLVACIIGLGFVVIRHLSGRRASGQDMVPLGLLLALAAYPAWVLMIGMAP